VIFGGCRPTCLALLIDNITHLIKSSNTAKFSRNRFDIRHLHCTSGFHTIRIVKFLIVKRLSGSIKSDSVGPLNYFLFDLKY